MVNRAKDGVDREVQRSRIKQIFSDEQMEKIDELVRIYDGEDHHTWEQ